MCQHGLLKQRDVLLFFADFPQTFTMSTRFAFLNDPKEADGDGRACE